MSGTRGKYWCFTLHGDFSHTDDITEIITIPDIKWILWQLEECPTTKRRHMQGVFELKSRKYLSWLKNINAVWNSMHLEMTRDLQASIEYCTKEESRIGTICIYHNI